MKIDVLLGLQWGDEGKGKAVDALAPNYDIVVRFQGGPNAGHTLEFNGVKFVTHHLACGLFQGKINVLANGMVIDPVEFVKEVKEVISKKLLTFKEIKKLVLIANKATLILPSHKSLDYVKETLRGESKIGSTQKGIGPAYSDKTSRNALLVRDIFSEDFLGKYEKLRNAHAHFAGSHGLSLDTEKVSFISMEEDFFEALDFFKQFTFINGERYLNEQLNVSKKIWVEGAQGTFLDIMYGSYPFVTSSNTTIGGVITGLGVPPQAIGEVYGLFKAYCTRVGNGPFPTELFDGNSLLDPLGKKMSDIGVELGATTGRQRRCGWLDLVMLRYACMINGVSQLIMTKADVMAGFETIKVATNYTLKDGTTTNDMPENLDEVSNVLYREFKSWPEIRGINHAGKAPQELMDYILFVENYLGIPITIVSTGPDREEIMRWD